MGSYTHVPSPYSMMCRLVGLSLRLLHDRQKMSLRVATFAVAFASSAAAVASVVTGSALAARTARYSWYESTSTGGCWNTGDGNHQCDTVGPEYLAGHMMTGEGITLASKPPATPGDYCNYIDSTGALSISNPDSEVISERTGLNPGSPVSEYQLGATATSGHKPASACQAHGNEWGQWLNSWDAGDSTCDCGMQHSVSFGAAAESIDRPWDSEWVGANPALVLENEGTGEYVSGTAWQYLCADLVDTESEYGGSRTRGIFEICASEWNSGAKGAQDAFECSRVSEGENTRAFMLATSYIEPGSKYLTMTPGSHETVFNDEHGVYRFSVSITTEDLLNAVRQAEKQCVAPVVFSHNPSAYALVGVENGREGVSAEYDGGHVSKLNAYTAYTPAQTNPVIRSCCSSAGFQFAFHANTAGDGDLWSYGDAGGGDQGSQMWIGTSPGLAVLSGGIVEQAFEGTNGRLWTKALGGAASETTDAMLPYTNPSVAALANGSYAVAFQASTGDLAIYNGATGTTTTTGEKMMPGTSPSISAIGESEYEVAYQSIGGRLAMYGGAGDEETGNEMAPVTSPSIATLADGKYIAAYQGTNRDLWTYERGAAPVDWQLGMMEATNPSITACCSSTGFEFAFQANVGRLWTYGNAGGGDTGQLMAEGTSPSITTLENGNYLVSYHGTNSDLWTYNPANGEAADWALGMK